MTVSNPLFTSAISFVLFDQDTVGVVEQVEYEDCEAQLEYQADE